ncbi:hypothetical protein [Micromonospora sp. L32]|uniref:hypothetical protein n=1 Tax=Micromonospora sp. L32 TaxID=3452214 RepID=UPI003F8BD001
MTTFFAGQPLTAQQLEDLRTFAIPLMVVKTADESVASSATPQDDNELFLTVTAGAKYRLLMHLVVGGTGTVGDLFIRFNAPAGSKISASCAGIDVGATGVVANMNAGAFNDVTTWPMPANFAYGTVANPTGILCMGNLTVGATGGTFRLQWSQATSSATATTIKSGSSLELTRYE